MANTFEQGLLRYLTTHQLETIQSARIGIAGAGGLGSNVAVALVRTGFRHLTMLDKDLVEASNLNRQDYTLADIGKPKVKTLKQRLITINPDVTIITHQSEWTSETADDFFSQCDILVEAFDRAETKSAFVNWASSHAKYVVTGNGMASLIGAGTPPLPRSPSRSPRFAREAGLRLAEADARQGAAPAGLTTTNVTAVKKIGNIYMVGDRETSITDGNPPLAPRVLQCAAKMAEIVLDLTLNITI